MTDIKKYFFLARPVLVPLFHLGVLFLVYKLLLFLTLIHSISDMGHYKRWDSYWYSSIAEVGYEYSDTKASNSGFFPMFPYIWKFLWKITGSGISGMCYLNIAIFFSGMLILKKAFKFSYAYFLLFVSIPSNMFMYIPYTEAAFFLFSSIMLAGLKTKNQVMILSGLFLASLTRPTAVFFIPAIICMEYFSFENWKKFSKNVLVYSSIPILGVLVVVLFQYKATGVWFAYFKAQSLFWKRTMQWPELPFTTWDGPRILWLDGFALFFGLMAIAILIIFLVRKYRKNNLIEKDNKAVFFSLCYMMMALFSIIFFNGKDSTGGTSLMGANRYLLATPYFIMMLLLISHHIKFEKDYFFSYILLAFLMYFLLRVDGPWFKYYDEGDKFFYRFLAIINIMLYFLISKYFKNRFIPLIYAINVVTQIILMHQIVIGKWIG